MPLFVLRFYFLSTPTVIQKNFHVISACTTFFFPFTKTMEQWNWSIISGSSLIAAGYRRRKIQIDPAREGKLRVKCTRGNPMHRNRFLRFRNDMKKSDGWITYRRDRTWVSCDFRTITRKSAQSRDKARGGERDYMAASALTTVFT